MTKAMARGIVKNIHTDAADPEEKLLAIQDVIDEESHRAVTKEEFVEVIRWLLEDYL